MFNEFCTSQVEFLGTFVLGLHKHGANANALGGNSDSSQGIGQNIRSKAATSIVAAYGEPAND
jgi:hypothetical protein